LVGGWEAGFGFFTFGGRLGVLSPMICLTFRMAYLRALLAH
jgi:hypothetical protein